MILSVLFTDWNFKLWAPSLAALCLHLALSHLVAVCVFEEDGVSKTQSSALTLTSALVCLRLFFIKSFFFLFSVIFLRLFITSNA